MVDEKHSRQTQVEEQLEQDSSTGGEGYRVLLYNDEVHTMQEVVQQLVKAIDCTVRHAEAIMIQAHNRGKAVVIIAEKAEALRVASVLREIHLIVRVDQI
jgi:ATP-dependent Clp protease adaptor protein ClpS